MARGGGNGTINRVRLYVQIESVTCRRRRVCVHRPIERDVAWNMSRQMGWLGICRFEGPLVIDDYDGAGRADESGRVREDTHAVRGIRNRVVSDSEREKDVGSPGGVRDEPGNRDQDRILDRQS